MDNLTLGDAPMKTLIAIMLSAILMLPVVSFSADAGTPASTPAPTSSTDKAGGGMMGMSVDQRVQMHQDMIKAHQDAIDCLKASTDPKECGKNFKTAMEQVRTKYFPNAKMFDMKKHCMMDNGMMDNK